MKKMRILPLSLALSLAVSIPASAASLSDVSGPYAQSIDNLVQRGVLQGDGTGSYRPEEALTRSAAASMLYNAFCLVPVFSMEAPAPEAGEDGTIPEPTTKAFYSTSTTVATLDAALIMPILRRSRANSTIRIAFFANRPINMINAICI